MGLWQQKTPSWRCVVSLLPTAILSQSMTSASTCTVARYLAYLVPTEQEKPLPSRQLKVCSNRNRAASRLQVLISFASHSRRALTSVSSFNQQASSRSSLYAK